MAGRLEQGEEHLARVILQVGVVVHGMQRMAGVVGWWLEDAVEAVGAA